MAPARAEWTIFTYIAAHNNLDAHGQRSLLQILGVGSTPQVQLAAFYDGSAGAARYLAGQPGQAATEDPLNTIDSADPQVLLTNACWAFEQLPAQHYAVVLWGHGTGWRPEQIEAVARQARGDAAVDLHESNQRAAMPGSQALFRSTLAEILKQPTATERAICFDDGTQHSLDTQQLGNVVHAISKTIGQPIDLLGMDACLMATLEVAYQVRESVQCLVASQELMPNLSWPYDRILRSLAADSRRTPRDLAIAVVQDYTRYYTAHPPDAGAITKVALDLSQISPLVSAVDQLAGALQDDMERQSAILWAAQHMCYERESCNSTREPNKFRYHLWDIKSLAAQLAAGNPSATVTQAAQTVVKHLQPGQGPVLAEGHSGDWFDGIGGISAYLVPPGRQRISPYYSTLAWARDTRWAAMLDAYHDAIG